MWEFENEQKPYPIDHHEDDTLRIAMIGDSWAEMHSYNLMDSVLELNLHNLTGYSVKMISKGKGGEKSKGVYKLLFEESNINGTKHIIASGLDYCIISAGINDAAANLGPQLYCYHMRLISARRFKFNLLNIKYLQHYFFFCLTKKMSTFGC